MPEQLREGGRRWKSEVVAGAPCLSRLRTLFDPEGRHDDVFDGYLRSAVDLRKHVDHEWPGRAFDASDVHAPTRDVRFVLENLRRCAIGDVVLSAVVVTSWHIHGCPELDVRVRWVHDL